MTSLIESAKNKANLAISRLGPALSVLKDGADWKADLYVARFKADEFEEALRSGERATPFSTSHDHKESLMRGLLLNGGGNHIWKAISVGAGATNGTAGNNTAQDPNTQVLFNTTNSHTGVGDSTTAAAVTQVDLQAVTNKLRKVVDSTWPKLVGASYTDIDGAAQTIAERQIGFRSTYGRTEANYSWQEFVVANHATSTVVTAGAGNARTVLDRFVSDQGTKVAQQVWELTIFFTLS